MPQRHPFITPTPLGDDLIPLHIELSNRKLRIRNFRLFLFLVPGLERFRDTTPCPCPGILATPKDRHDQGTVLLPGTGTPISRTRIMALGGYADDLSNSDECDNSGLPTNRSSPCPFASRMMLVGSDRVGSQIPYATSEHMCADTERPGDRSDRVGKVFYCVGNPDGADFMMSV